MDGPTVIAQHSPGRGRPASRPGDEDLPVSPACQAAAAAAAGRLHCLTTARVGPSADLQIQATSLWEIRQLPPQDQEKKTSVLLYRESLEVRRAVPGAKEPSCRQGLPSDGQEAKQQSDSPGGALAAHHQLASSALGRQIILHRLL